MCAYHNCTDLSTIEHSKYTDLLTTSGYTNKQTNKPDLKRKRCP